MSNRYEIKIFSNDGEYKTTINPNAVMNDVQITSNVNGGLWQLSLNVAFNFWDQTFKGGDFVQVILYNERNKNWKQIYFGFISKIERKLEANRQYLTLVVLWVASLLKSVIFSWETTWTAGSIIRTAVDCFNAEYWNILKIWRIDPWENISLEINDWTSCRAVIDAVNKVQNYFRFVDGEWMFRFRQKKTQKKHILVNWKSVESLTTSTSIEWICNKLFLEREDKTVEVYEDAESQMKYSIKEKFISNSQIKDTTTQDEYWNNYILENKDPKDETSIVVNSLYEIETIEPWDLVSVVNIEYWIRDLIVEKVKLSPSKATLTIEENETLRDVISN